MQEKQRTRLHRPAEHLLRRASVGGQLGTVLLRTFTHPALRHAVGLEIEHQKTVFGFNQAVDNALHEHALLREIHSLWIVVSRRDEHGKFKLAVHRLRALQLPVEVRFKKSGDVVHPNGICLRVAQNMPFPQAFALGGTPFRTLAAGKITELQKQMVRRPDFRRRQPARVAVKERTPQFGTVLWRLGILLRLLRAKGVGDGGRRQLGRQIAEYIGGIWAQHRRLQPFALRKCPVYLCQLDAFLPSIRHQAHGKAVRCVHIQLRRLGTQCAQLRGIWMAHQRHAQPQRILICARQRIRRNRVERRNRRPFFRLLRRITHCARTDELFLCARQCDIQHAQLLAHHFAAQRTRHRPPVEPVVLDAARHVAAAHADPHALVQQHRLVQVELVKLFCTVCQNDNREFQSLGFVNRHDAHHACGFLAVRHSQRAAGLAQLPQKTHKGKQAAAAAALKRARQLSQRRDVVLSCASARHRAKNTHCTCAVHNMPQQLAHRHIRRKQAQLFQLFQKRARLFVCLRRRAHRSIKITVAVSQPNLCQFLLGKARQRRSQRRQQRHILPRVVHNFQPRHQRMHLRCVQHVVRRIRARRNAAFTQRLLENRRLVFCRAQQDDKVLRAAGAQFSRLFVGHAEAALQHLPDAPGTVVRLLSDGLRRVLIVRLCLEQADLRAVIIRAFRERRADMQRFAVSVIQIAQLFAHQGRKQEIDAVKHLWARTEVFGKHDTARRGIGDVLRIAVRQIFLQKNRWIGETEAVNALFDIADHKDVFFLIADCAKNRVLHRIGILVFVDHDFGKMHVVGQLGRRTVRIGQQFDREVLEVVEIHDTAPQLLLLVGIHERLYRIAQRAHGGCHHVHIQPDFFLRHAQHTVHQLK